VKDREVVFPINERVQIAYLRTSEWPAEYAVMLQERDGDGWKTRLVADNSHEDGHVDAHHFHRYIDDQKQAAEALPFKVSDTKDAMAKAIRWFADKWEELIS
jgi:hypothetical protein